MDPDRCYAFNEAEYLTYLRPAYVHSFVPRTWLQFPVILPYYLPFDQVGSFSIPQDHFGCTYQFMTISSRERYSAGLLGDAPASVEKKRTRVEMIYVTTDEIEYSGDFNPSPYFDLLLEELNKFILAYLVVSKDTFAYRLSKEMLEFFTLCRFAKLDPWRDERRMLFLLHSGVSYNVEPLSTAYIEAVLRASGLISQAANPFVLAEELFITAVRYSREGFYREAVIFAQMSIETLLTSLLECLLSCEGRGNLSGLDSPEDRGFIRMVRSDFHGRLGGCWNTEDGDSVIGKWYVQTYRLRNRVVHAGYYPPAWEAGLALDAANEFRQYVVALVKERKARYPEVHRHLTL